MVLRFKQALQSALVDIVGVEALQTSQVACPPLHGIRLRQREVGVCGRLHAFVEATGSYRLGKADGVAKFVRAGFGVVVCAPDIKRRVLCPQCYAVLGIGHLHLQLLLLQHRRVLEGVGLELFIAHPKKREGECCKKKECLLHWQNPLIWCHINI